MRTMLKDNMVFQEIKLLQRDLLGFLRELGILGQIKPEEFKVDPAKIIGLSDEDRCCVVDLGVCRETIAQARKINDDSR
jgi:hypothetical protein